MEPSQAANWGSTDHDPYSSQEREGHRRGGRGPHEEEEDQVGAPDQDHNPLRGNPGCCQGYSCCDQGSYNSCGTSTSPGPPSN